MIAERWHSAAQTHPGRRRRTNEDSVVALPELGVWAVADGMGGHDAGDYASRAIAEALGTLRDPGSLTDLVDRVDDLLGTINDQLRDHSERCCEGRTVGSTVVALVSNGDVGVALWAGDSRLYRVRGGEMSLKFRSYSSG